MAPSADTQTSVRPARGGDAGAIGAIQSRSWRMAYASLLTDEALAALTPEALSPVWERAVRTPPSAAHGVFVALSDDIVVGFAATGPSDDRDAGQRDGQLAVLVVDPAHQRDGHGSRLLSAVAEHLRDLRMTTISAWLPHGDLARETFFTSAGMTADGARRTYTGPGGTPVAEIRLMASLTSA